MICLDSYSFTTPASRTPYWNVNVMLVTLVTVLRVLASTSMNVMMDPIPVTKTPLVPIMMVVSLVLTNDECTTTNNDCHEGRSVCTKVDSAVLAMLVTMMITFSDDN